jgi:signal transduction histidine kinase
MLASVKMYLSSFQDGTERQQELIRRSVETLRTCMDEIRKLSRSLVPPSLGDIGLTDAVEELLQHFSDAESGIRFTSHISMEEKRIPIGLQLSVYRIIQEQFSNIIKYAGASHVSLHLKQFDGRLLLEVADDGRGFDTSQKRKGIGITNMINRAELYNGKFNLVSSPGNGCVLTVEFYLQNESP